MFNPCDKKSIGVVEDKIKYSGYYLSVYPDSVWDEMEENAKYGEYRPPRNIFLPSNSVMKVMIMANLKFAARDKEDAFLARFGIYEHLPFMDDERENH